MAKPTWSSWAEVTFCCQFSDKSLPGPMPIYWLLDSHEPFCLHQNTMESVHQNAFHIVPFKMPAIMSMSQSDKWFQAMYRYIFHRSVWRNSICRKQRKVRERAILPIENCGGDIRKCVMVLFSRRYRPVV